MCVCVEKEMQEKRTRRSHAATCPAQIQTAVRDPVVSQQCSMTQLLPLYTHTHTHPLAQSSSAKWILTRSRKDERERGQTF